MKKVKFKLIKKYPGSPPLHTIEEFWQPDWGFMKDNAEFWEEITTCSCCGSEIQVSQKVDCKCDKKDYEILSFVYPDGSICDRYKSIFIDHLDLLEGRIPGFKPTCKAGIHSIRRLSDNEVFTIGDRMYYKDEDDNLKRNGCPITSFTIEGDKIYVNSHNVVKNKGNILENWTKWVKLKLFTTKDGVDIYVGGWAWLLHKHTFIVSSGSIHFNNPIYKDSGADWKFSTKEAAEHFAIMNKPCLSIEDLINHSDGISHNFIAYLKQTVKMRMQ